MWGEVVLPGHTRKLVSLLCEVQKDLSHPDKTPQMRSGRPRASYAPGLRSKPAGMPGRLRRVVDLSDIGSAAGYRPRETR